MSVGKMENFQVFAILHFWIFSQILKISLKSRDLKHFDREWYLTTSFCACPGTNSNKRKIFQKFEQNFIRKKTIVDLLIFLLNRDNIIFLNTFFMLWTGSEPRNLQSTAMNVYDGNQVACPSCTIAIIIYEWLRKCAMTAVKPAARYTNIWSMVTGNLGYRRIQ